MVKVIEKGIIIGKAKTFVDIVEPFNHEIRTMVKIKPLFITYHNTGNKGKGANAEAHNNLIHNLGDKLPRDTSHIGWHFTVDSEKIYQHLPLDEMAYHCGDGTLPKSGNKTSIGIEICMHSDEKNYPQAEENAIALGLYLEKLLNIKKENHVPHKKWSGKNCPQVILERDKGFTKFYNRIQNARVKKVEESKKEEVFSFMFSDKKTKEMFAKRTASKATSELLDKAAIKHLGMKSKLVNGRLSNGDMAAIATELAVLYAKANK